MEQQQHAVQNCVARIVSSYLVITENMFLCHSKIQYPELQCGDVKPCSTSFSIRTSQSLSFKCELSSRIAVSVATNPEGTETFGTDSARDCVNACEISTITIIMIVATMPLFPPLYIGILRILCITHELLLYYIPTHMHPKI